MPIEQQQQQQHDGSSSSSSSGDGHQKKSKAAIVAELEESGENSTMMQLEKNLEDLSNRETENLVHSFQEHFDRCTKACKKPNILVAGITGAGKSSLTNAVFGENLAQAGAGLPVTQHFQKFEPKDKPIIIYDSKGLEWSEHEEFIRETGKFFTELRQKADVADHIHVVWYVVNAARGRFESFEAALVREVFNPTPVIFVLNKSDLADSKQLKAIKKVIEDENLPNNKGIHICISERTTWTQPWCPACLSDDVFYDEETKELECSDCSYTCIQEKTHGMKKLVEHTCELLPELAKDAFMYSQTASIAEKDHRARSIVKKMAHGISLDSSGAFIKKVAEICAKLFIIWGWPLTADTFRDGLAQMQKEYVTQLKFGERMAAATIDKLLGSRLSKAFSGFIGITMNRGMKRLNESLIEHCARGDISTIKMDDFMEDSDLNEDLMKLFFQTALVDGIDVAIDRYWDLTPEELMLLAQQMNLDQEGNDLFGGVDLSQFADQSALEQLMNADAQEEGDVNIGEVNVDADVSGSDKKEDTIDDLD